MWAIVEAPLGWAGGQVTTRVGGGGQTSGQLGAGTGAPFPWSSIGEAGMEARNGDRPQRVLEAKTAGDPLLSGAGSVHGWVWSSGRGRTLSVPPLLRYSQGLGLPWPVQDLGA